MSSDNDESLSVECKKNRETNSTDENQSHSTIENIARKRYACQQCGQCFNHASNLSRHRMTIHEKKHKFACDQCFKIFTQMCHLKTHKQNVHAGIRSQLCGLCGKSFQSAPLLKRHLLLHTGKFHTWKFV